MKNKKIICYFIFILILFINLPIYAENASVELISSSDLDNLISGDTLDINIILRDTTDFVGCKLLITYDPNVLTIRDKNILIENTTNFSEYINSDDGQAVLAFSLNKDVETLSGDINLACISYDVLTKGESTLSIGNDSRIIYEDIEGNLSEDDITNFVLSYHINGTGSLSGTVNLEGRDTVDNLMINILDEDEIVYSTSTNPDGTFTINNIIEGNYTLKIDYEGYIEYIQNIQINNEGTNIVNIDLTKQCEETDLNTDGNTTIEDLVLVGSLYGLDSNCESWNEDTSRADFNNDNKINIIDLTYINRRIER